jgi:hypothetical protein
MRKWGKIELMGLSSTTIFIEEVFCVELLEFD